LRGGLRVGERGSKGGEEQESGEFMGGHGGGLSVVVRRSLEIENCRAKLESNFDQISFQ
jgi:hypothetical protein